MTMHITVQTRGDTARLVLQGRFDFNAHHEFRHACEEALAVGEGREIEVDLDRVEYLDSSALGMLLLLREKAHNTARTLALVNCRGLVRQVLEVAKFERLFTIR